MCAGWRRAGWLSALVLLAGALAAPALAQGIEPAQRGRFAQQLTGNAQLTIPPLTLEGVLDADAYVVGPGDVFTVAIGGAIPIVRYETVSADGRLVFPELGAFDVAGEALADVLAAVDAALDAAYRNVPANVSLSSPRRFYVHVSGAVVEPGRKLVGPVARVSEALLLEAREGTALETLLPSADTRREAEELRLERERLRQQQLLTIAERGFGLGADEAPRVRPAFRNVLVTHRDGTQERIDLQRYFATGDTQHNPLLRDGDAVHVPVFAVRLEGVFVDGDLIDGALYDHRADDTVQALAEIALGPEALTQVQAVRVANVAADGAATTTTYDAEALRSGPPVPVAPRAQVYFVTQDPDAGLVSALGALRYPGAYPIRVGQTTLRQLVEAAGGLDRDAAPRLAVLERPILTAGDEDALVYRDAARLSTLDFLSREYFQRSLEQYQRIPLTPAMLSDPDAAPVYLRDGDRLLVPEGTDAIQVLGQVRRPGFVDYAPGADAAYYLTEAGGLADGASEVYVVDSVTGEMSPQLGGVVEPGSRLFVTRPAQPQTEQQQQIALQLAQLEQQQARERRTLTFDIVRTGLAVVTTVITFVLFLERSE